MTNRLFAAIEEVSADVISSPAKFPNTNLSSLSSNLIGLHVQLHLASPRLTNGINQLVINNTGVALRELDSLLTNEAASDEVDRLILFLDRLLIGNLSSIIFSDDSCRSVSLLLVQSDDSLDL